MFSATGGGPARPAQRTWSCRRSALAVVPLAVIARLTRANVLEVARPAVRAHRAAKGLPPLHGHAAATYCATRWSGRSPSWASKPAGCWPARSTSRPYSPGRARRDAGKRDPAARLSVGPGRRAAGGHRVRRDQSGHRHAVPVSRSAAAACAEHRRSVARRPAGAAMPPPRTAAPDAGWSHSGRCSPSGWRWCC